MKANGRDKAPQGGFTLIEILLTMAVLAILATIVIGGVDVVNKNARAKRNALACKVLQTAINRYRTEYNEWPVDREEGVSKTTYVENNYEVISPLREDDAKNYDRIRFIDETSLFTTEDGDLTSAVIPLSQSSNQDAPIVFVPKNRQKKGKPNLAYFKITIDFDSDTVSVTAPEPAIKKSELRDEDKY